MSSLKSLLDFHAKAHANDNALFSSPDPLIVAKRHNPNAEVALICALFAYGNAKAILKFLESLDYSVLDDNIEVLEHKLSGKYYRFHKDKEIIAIFMALNIMRKSGGLEPIFKSAYQANCNVLDGITACQLAIYKTIGFTNEPLGFLIGTPAIKPIGHAPLKRWNLFLRWMSRSEAPDLGLWSWLNPKDLIIPLDVHLHRAGLKLGLINRKRYDLAAALELTSALRKFDENDPVKYDFALYRLGQSKSDIG
jgi:uncharacterized protein (TIGR02757 family)